MAGVAGLEPTNAGVKVPCLNRLGYTPTIHENHSKAVVKCKMAPRTGLEPVTF